MDLLQDFPDIEFVLALHEGVAVAMADAYARLTDRPAFVEVHIAPGLGNAIGMLHNARVGRTPLVVYAGQAESRALFMEPHLSGQLVEMARPVCKWAAQIEHAADVPAAMRRAFKVADEPPRGPVFLSLPMDVLDETAEMTIAPTSFTRWRSRPDSAAIKEAAELLLRAERPMILAGDGVGISGGQAELVDVAELLGAAIFEVYASEFNVPATHPLNLGGLDFLRPDEIRKNLAGCDVLLTAGAPVFQVVFPDPDRPMIGPNTRLVQIDADPWQISRNRPADVGLLADPKAALADLGEELSRQRTGSQAAAAAERSAAIGRRTQQLADGFWEAARRRWDAEPITPARLTSELKAALPPNSLVFTEPGTSQVAVQRAFAPDGPGQLLRVRGGGIGEGLPGAVGAQLACPDRKVIGLCSDGSSMYSITALWSAAHHRVPLTWVMLNNASYRVLKLNVLDYLGERAAGRKFVAMDLTDPDLRFDRMAESMGVPAWRVTRPDDLAPVLKEALAEGPSLVDVVIDGAVPTA